jgi:two-component system LytT family response regulator
MIRTLLIEDDATIRADLRQLLAAHADVAIVGEAARFAEAKALLAAVECDLVFLDIALIGGSGLELVPFVRPGTHVVFATGLEEHALRAFEVNALDYLLKPVRVSRLADSLERFRQRRGTVAPDPRPSAYLSDDIVHLKSGGTARFVPVMAISMVVAQENYSLVHLRDGPDMLVRRNLAEWEALLPATHFQRVHRQTIVNLSRVTGYRPAGLRSAGLRIEGVSEFVPVSRRSWMALKARLSVRFGPASR